MALFWLRTSYHAQRYMLRSLLTQSFNIVNTPIISLFAKKWVPGFAAEDNRTYTIYLFYRLSKRIWQSTVYHQKIMEFLNYTEIDKKDLRIVQNLYWEQKAVVRLQNGNSEAFNIERGVR